MFNLKEKFIIFIKASLIAIVIFIGYSFAKDFFGGEEGKVRKVIVKGKRAVEQRDIVAFALMVSKNYHDTYGNDNASILYAAKEFFNYYKTIVVTLKITEIRLEDAQDKAVVLLEALVVGVPEHKEQEKILEGEKGNFQITLLKEDKEWRLLRLEFLKPLTVMGQTIS